MTEEGEGSSGPGSQVPYETPGTARKKEVVLESDTASLGTKCGSPTCYNISNVGQVKFKMCGGCKKVVYCSRHCQGVHWREGHRNQCNKENSAAVNIH